MVYDTCSIIRNSESQSALGRILCSSRVILSHPRVLNQCYSRFRIALIKRPTLHQKLRASLPSHDRKRTLRRSSRSNSPWRVHHSCSVEAIQAQRRSCETSYVVQNPNMVLRIKIGLRAGGNGFRMLFSYGTCRQKTVV